MIIVGIQGFFECEVRNQFNRFIISISRLDVYVQTGYFCLPLSFISEKSEIFGSSEIFSVVVLKGEIKYPLSFALRKTSYKKSRVFLKNSKKFLLKK